MKKLILLLSIFIFLIVALPAESANLYWRNCLTGGGDCLDGIDGASLADGDGAFVIRDNSGTYEGYIYRLEETAVAESSPDVISPDANAGDKRWRLVNIHAIGFTGPLTGDVTGKADTATTALSLTLADDSTITPPVALPSTTKSGVIQVDDTGASAFIEPTSLCFFMGALNGLSFECSTPASARAALETIPYYGELTTEHFVIWFYDDVTDPENPEWKVKAGDLPATDNTTNGKLVKKVVDEGVHTLEDAEAGTDYAAPNADTTGTASKLPVDTATDAEGEESSDGTSGQFRYYVNGIQRVHSPKKTFSVVVPSVADTDDMLIMKAPYGMTLTAIDCIVSAATSATINIQECGADGTSCSDTATSDLACDTDNANTTTFNNAVIDSGDWIKLDVASISGTPGTLSVTVTYTIVAD